MALFYFLLRTARRLMILAIVIGAASGIGSAGLIILINTTISSPDGPHPTLAWSYGGLCLLVVVAKFASEYLFIRLSQGAILNLRMQLSERILSAPLRQLETVGTHRLLAMLTDDTLVLANAFANVPVLSLNIAIVFGCLLYLSWLSWVVSVSVLGLMLVGALIYQIPTRYAHRSMSNAREEQDQLLKHFQALTYGIKELKLHRQRRRNFFSVLLGPTAHAFRRYYTTGMSYYAAAGSWGQALFFIVIGALLFILPLLMRVNLQTIIGCTLALLYLMTPLEAILNIVPWLSRANVALKKIDALGLSLSSAPEETEATPPAPDWQQLELKGVTHAYHNEAEDRDFVLGPLDLTFTPGELVFLVGGNGSGKTTFAKILTGLYTPDEGEVWFQGQRITDENKAFYRQHFSAVFSDFYLFANLPRSDAPEMNAGAYLTRLQLDHKVQINDGVLSTTELSQGQRKRLALLTAYMEDRPIYLFDEWAADQDPYFKEIFYLQLLPELKARGKTVIVINHDDRYYHLADRLIRLDSGKVCYNSRDEARPYPQAISRMP